MTEIVGHLTFLGALDWIEVTGWVGAILTLAAYSMRTMFAFRAVALGSNVFFIAFGSLAGIHPTLALHVVLVALNLYRMRQILRDIELAKGQKAAADWTATLKPYMKKQKFAAGTLLFKKGDPPDMVYLVSEGSVRLPEIDTRLGAGELFGEIGFLTDSRKRTLSAVCETDCVLLTATEEAFTAAYYQSPALGMAILRLVATRLNALANPQPDDATTRN